MNKILMKLKSIKKIAVRNIFFVLLLVHFTYPIQLVSNTTTKTILKPYGAYINYQNAQYKKWAYNTGAYLYFGYGLHHSFEFDGNLTNFDIKDAYTFEDGVPTTIFLNNFKQKEFTFVYTNYSIKKMQIRAGLHYLLTDNEQTDGTFSYIFGLHKVAPYHYTFGLNAYATFYQYTEAVFNVFQLSPQAGYYFGDYFSYGSFYADFLFNIIKLSEDPGWQKKIFYSFKPSLYYYYKKLILYGYLRIGEEIYSMRNNGFLLLYLPENQTFGFGGSINLQISENFSTGILISKGKYEESLNSGKVDVTTILFNLGFSFQK